MCGIVVLSRPYSAQVGGEEQTGEFLNKTHLLVLLLRQCKLNSWYL